MSKYDGDELGLGALVGGFLLICFFSIVGFSLWSYFGPKYQKLQTDTIQNSEAHIEGVKNRIKLSLDSYCKALPFNDEATIATQRQMILMEAQSLSNIDQLGTVGDPVRDAVEALQSDRVPSCK